MLERFKRIFSGQQSEPRRPLELTVQDQWVLKFLFLVKDRYASQEDIVLAVMEERPTFIPHEILAAAHKLHRVGALEQNEQEWYRVAPKARKLQDILPEWPGVNLDYYG